MTIRKITGRTSSLAVKATVTQGGIFKAALQKPTGIQSLQNKSSILIPKIANVTAKVINHLLYDPEGFGMRHVYDWLSINTDTVFNLGKSTADTASLGDVLISRIIRNREPADAFSTTEYLNFLLRTSRTFDDVAAILDTPSLGLRKPVADTQSLTDFFLISRVKNFDETIAGSDTFGRIFNTSRNFEDTVGMLDAFVFIDGSTFELRRRLYDTVSVNTSDVELIRNSGNSTESFSFFIDKVLDPDMELLDQIAKLGLKSITDADITSADQTFLYAEKPLADTAAPADVQPVFVGLKYFTDTENLIDELIQFSLAKLLADTTTMLDNMSFGDNLVYDSTKLFAHVFDQLDRPYLWFAPATKYDDIDLTDANSSRFIKANTDSADLTENNTKVFGKNTSSIFSLADILSIARLKDYADVFTPTDLNTFAITKLFADTVEADDPLIRLSDGNISLIIKQNRSNQPADDYFARAVKFYRYPHHGDGELGNFVLASEKDSKFVSLRARAGVLKTYPIIRTNVIAWSEQFNTNQSGGYWTSTGATVLSNQSPAPQNVVSSNSATYDADQLQELFYNKPNNSYARNWYQLAPNRWVASSDGDLLVQDSSTGIHQLSTPNIPELIGTTNFGFAVYLKYAGHRYVRLWVTSFVNVDVDLVNNVVVQTSAAKASIQPVGGGWFLVEVENRIVNFGIAPEMQILNEIFYNSTNSPYGLTQYKLVPDNIISSARIVLLDSSLNTTFTGDGVSGVYVWGAQLEVGDQPEQEISSLRYIRTAGGSASRVGFNVTPADNDRVFVGRIQRRGGNERGTDANEIVSFLLQYRTAVDSNLATPTDYFARSVRYFRNGVIESGLGSENTATIGLPGQRRYSGDAQENVAFYINKYAKSGTTSTGAYVTNRANYLRYSERFDYPYWVKTNVTASSGISVLSRALPYRNVVLDANQIHEMVYNGRYNYQAKRWYNLAPLTNRATFTSNAIVDIFESSANDVHAVQAFGFSTNLSGDYFASSVYASPNNGVSKFRMQVGTVWADFDLSSNSVITSSGTLYNNIRAVDTSTGWYLCQIIGPTVALGTLNFLETLAVPDRISLLRPYVLNPDSFTPTDLRYNYFIKGLADSSTMLDNFFIGDGITYAQSKTLLDSFTAGGFEGYRTSGNPLETVSFVDKFVARRSGEVTSQTIKLFANTILQADNVVDVFPNRTNKTWFQLAPYYSHSAHILDYPTDYERVRVGSQTGGRRQSGNPYETTQLLFGRPVSGDFVKLGGTSYLTTVLSQNLLLTSGNPETNTSYPGFGTYWYKRGTGTRIATNVAAAPFPSATSAWGIVATSPNPFTKAVGVFPGTPLNYNTATQYTLSVYATFNYTTRTGHAFNIDFGGGTSNSQIYFNNLNPFTGEAGYILDYVGSPSRLDNFYTESVGGGWFRIVLTFTTAVNPGYVGGIDFYQGNLAGGAAFGTSDTIVFFGPQLQLGTIATPYQRTTSTTITSNTASVASTTTFRLQPSQSSSENTIFFTDKRIDETKLIPTYPRYDAAAVMGLFYNTTRNIDGRRYTPQDGNYTYYKKTDWYSEAPRYARPRFAWGTGNTPGTIMIDNMALGDNLSYYENFNLKDFFLAGSTDGRRGTSDNENLSYFLNLNPRRGVFTDLYIAKVRPTRFDADQALEIFYGTSNNTRAYTYNNPYRKKWYQLAPYYASYDHYKNTPGEYDFVRVGSVRGADRANGWPQEIMQIVLTKRFADATTMLDRFDLGDQNVFFQDKSFFETPVIGLPFGLRVSGDTAENVSFVNKFVARRGNNTTTSTLLNLGGITRLQADVTADVYTNLKTSSPIINKWYQLAPYYRSRLYDQDSDLDRVRVGSQTTPNRSSSNPYETISFLFGASTKFETSTATDVRINFINKSFSETRQIPNIAKYDAAAVMGLYVSNKTARTIDLNKYTPLTSNVTYYKAYDWYSEAPLSNRAKFAIGNAGIGPVMIDNFTFGDQLTYFENKFLSSISITIGTQTAPMQMYYPPITGTNYAVYSEDFTQTRAANGQGVYSTGGATQILSNVITAPDGTLTGDGITNDGGTLFLQYQGGISGITLNSSTNIVLSGYINFSRTTNNPHRIAVNNFNGAGGSFFYIYKSGVIGSNIDTTFTSYTTNVGNGWIRWVLGYKHVNSNNYIDVYLGSPYYGDSYTTSNYICMWGMQVEFNVSSAGAYTRTTSSAIIQELPRNIAPRFSNDSSETIAVNLRKDAKQSRFLDVYIAKVRPTKYNADQALEIFYGTSNNTTAYTYNNPYRKAWYQLAPYYNSYEHQLSSPNDRDRVYVGSRRGADRANGWPHEILQLLLLRKFDDIATMLDRFDIGDQNVFYENKSFFESIISGLPYGQRVSGDTTENISFVNKFVARRGNNTTTSTLLNLGGISKIQADTTADVFVDVKTSTPIINKWYQLAPYYRSRLYDNDSDYDRVRIGSQTTAKRSSSNPYETVSFWLAPKPLVDTTTSTDTKAQYIRKEFSETRQIPQVSKFDAARVAGIDLVSSGAQSINLKTYTPLSGGTQYYKAYDWYSLAPLYSRATFALGNAGTGPIMIDNMALGDDLTYTGNKFLSSINVTVGTQLGGARFSGDVAETQDNNLRKSAKQSTFIDLYVKLRKTSPLDADQVQEIFYGTSNNVRSVIRNNPYKRQWYQLAPYYNSYSHIRSSPQDTDRILLTKDEIYQNWLIKATTDSLSTAGDSGFRAQTGQTSGETTKFFMNRNAYKSGTSSSIFYNTIRTNYIRYSEDFKRTDYWEKIGLLATTSNVLMSGLYPYRNLQLDASHINEFFYATSNNTTAYNYYNNYNKKNWYSVAPLTSRSAFTSNVLTVLTEDPILSPHYVEATANLPDTTTPNNYFSYSSYVQNINGVRYIRLAVDRTYCDYDLSSQTVVSSSGVIYGKISLLDTSLGVYLCQYIGQTAPVLVNRIRVSFSSDTVTAADFQRTNTDYVRGPQYNLSDLLISTEIINNDKITDYFI